MTKHKLTITLAIILVLALLIGLSVFLFMSVNQAFDSYRNSQGISELESKSDTFLAQPILLKSTIFGATNNDRNHEFCSDSGSIYFSNNYQISGNTITLFSQSSNPATSGACGAFNGVSAKLVIPEGKINITCIMNTSEGINSDYAEADCEIPELSYLKTAHSDSYCENCNPPSNNPTNVIYSQEITIPSQTTITPETRNQG